MKPQNDVLQLTDPQYTTQKKMNRWPDGCDTAASQRSTKEFRKHVLYTLWMLLKRALLVDQHSQVQGLQTSRHKQMALGHHKVR